MAAANLWRNPGGHCLMFSALEIDGSLTIAGGYFFVALAVLATSGSQVMQALAARRLPANVPLLKMLLSPWVLTAYGLLALGLVFWLLGLTQLEISRTYPLFALSFVVVMSFARFGLKETVSGRAWLGAGLIVGGCVLCNLP